MGRHVVSCSRTADAYLVTYKHNNSLKMKRLFQNYLAICGALLLCVGCGSEDLTKHGSLPSSIADIELGTTSDVRPGQPMTAQVTLPVGGENYTEISYSWQHDNNAWNDASNIENGKAYRQFTAAETPGNHSLSFRARYVYLAPDVNGNLSGELISTVNYTVETCDVFSSKWGDSMEKTIEVYPQTSKVDETQCLGAFPDPFAWNTFNPENINRLFHFEENRLTEITDFFTYTSSKAGGYIYKLQSACLDAEESYGFTVVRSYYLSVGEGTSSTTEINLLKLDGEERDALGARMAEGGITLTVELTSATCDLRMNAGQGENQGEVDYMRTFTSKP